MFQSDWNFWFVPIFKKNKKRYAYLVFGNLRNFQIVYEKRHSGSHAMAWAAITTSYTLRFSQDLQYKTWHFAVPRFVV